MLRERKIPLLIAACVVVRALFIVFHSIDSDEPQHLHVVWGWSRGLVQYRDLFDVHFPLLHLISVPLMYSLPESSAAFLWMRLAMLPLAVLCSWLLFVIGRPLLGTRQAAIAAVLFSVLPPWFPHSVEFRNDALWILFWLAAVALVTARREPAWLAAGIAFALCLLASVKALPLLLAHALALALLRQHVSWKALARFAGGAAIPLAITMAFFYARGALDDMVYATLLFPASMPVNAMRKIGGAVAFVAVVPLLMLLGRSLRNRANAPAMHAMLFALCYVIVLLCFWPIIRNRDYLPLVPLVALALASSWAGRVAPATAFVAATATAVWYAEIWPPAEAVRMKFVDAAVRLTARDEYVYDLKGDAVFRRRPVFYTYETIGRELTSNGTIPDRGPEQIVARHCCVAMNDTTHIPARTRAFLNASFLEHGPLRVCGSIVRGAAFTIAVPETYAVLAGDPSRVVIDGAPYRAPRFLAAGRHTLDAAGPVTVIWWRAAKEIR